MEGFAHVDSATAAWQTFSEGVEMLALRSEPGANRVLLRFAPGKGYPTHHHGVAEEVYVIEGVYEDMGQRFGPGAYLYYPPGSVHNAFSTTGCTFLVINAKQGARRRVMFRGWSVYPAGLVTWPGVCSSHAGARRRMNRLVHPAVGFHLHVSAES